MAIQSINLKPHLLLSGLPQMIVYLAAVQQARLAHHKINTSVFGIMTDSNEFKFTFLDSSMKLFVTNLMPGAVIGRRSYIRQILFSLTPLTPHHTSLLCSLGIQRCLLMRQPCDR